METRKHKNQSTLPDKRLAKAFNFSYEDLATNRLGFITSAQEMNIPFWQRALFNRIGSILSPFPKKQRAKVGKRCGRVEVHHKVRPLYNSISHTITHMIDEYRLSIRDKYFKLNVAQYHAITGDVFYTVYYDTINHRIVAIERIPNDC